VDPELGQAFLQTLHVVVRFANWSVRGVSVKCYPLVPE
jgi:hypothetical protein